MDYWILLQTPSLLHVCSPSSAFTTLANYVVARLKGSVEHLAQYLAPTILTALNDQYEYDLPSHCLPKKTDVQLQIPIDLLCK